MPFRQAAVVTGASVRTKTRQFSSYVLVNTCDCLPNTSLFEGVRQCDGFCSRCGLKRPTTTFFQPLVLDRTKHIRLPAVRDTDRRN